MFFIFLLWNFPGPKSEILRSASERVQVTTGQQQTDNRETALSDNRGSEQIKIFEEGKARCGVWSEEQDNKN